METKVNHLNPRAPQRPQRPGINQYNNRMPQNRAGQNNTAKFVLTAVGSGMVGAALAAGAAAALHFGNKWREQLGNGFLTPPVLPPDEPPTDIEVVGGNGDGPIDIEPVIVEPPVEPTPPPVQPVEPVQPVDPIQPTPPTGSQNGPQNGNTPQNGNNGNDVTIDNGTNIDNVDPNDVAVEIADEVDPNDNDVQTIFAVDDIDTIHTEDGTEMIAALIHTPDGEQHYMIDTDNDMTFDVITDLDGQNPQQLGLPFTVSDAQDMLDNSGGYLAPTVGDDVEIAQGDHVTEVDVVDTDGSVDIAALDNGGGYYDNGDGGDYEETDPYDPDMDTDMANTEYDNPDMDIYDV